MNKREALAQLNSDYNHDIIMATETWLNDSIKSSELLLEKYNTYRRDRFDKIRGGVLIAIKKELDSEVCHSSKSTESLYCKINVCSNRTVIVGSVYRPPKSDSQNMNEISKELTEIKTKHKNAVFLDCRRF